MKKQFERELAARVLCAGIAVVFITVTVLMVVKSCNHQEEPVTGISDANLFFEDKVSYMATEALKSHITVAEEETEETTEEPRKTDEEIADEVIQGLWGNGEERELMLKQAGYDFQTIQDIVDSKMPSYANAIESISYEGEVYELANGYGIPGWQVDRALKLISYECYGADPTLDYYMACTVVNRFVDYGTDINIYTSWGGGDGSYGSWMDGLRIADHSVSALIAAFNNLDRNAWDCHGIVAENGYSHGVQRLDEAIYVSYLGGMYFGVWGREAGWY